MTRMWRRGAAAPMLVSVLALGGAASVGVAAGGDGTAVLDRLTPGAWELRDPRGGGAVRRLCLGDARLLLQPRHPGARCTRLVAEATADHVVVTYNCAGAGNGRTRVRVETPRLATIDTQGIADGAPFAMTLEARHVGACD